MSSGRERETEGVRKQSAFSVKRTHGVMCVYGQRVYTSQ